MFVSCGQSTPYTVNEGFTQGTIYKIIYESPKGVDYGKEITQLLRDFSASMSTYDPNSLISRINKNDPTVEVDTFFRTVFNKSVEINKASSGAFDITISPIVNFWGFGFTSDTPETDATKIDSILQYVGMDKIHISGNRVIKKYPEVMVDVNAIAKGYSVDVVSDFLKKKGCKNYLVNIGGEIIAKGVNASGKTWVVGIERPAENARYGDDYKAMVQLSNRALATSGNYRRFFEINGAKYGHSIDVKTGYPARNNLLSATILARDCMTADAWATTCMVAGLQKSMELLKEHPELDAFLIYSDEEGNYQTYATEGLKKSIMVL
jgi:thiamine biosynthesis lipoprotein